jgi:hypothetical protein
MSALTFSVESWVSLLAQTTAQARATAMAGWFSGGATIEFRDAADTLIRSVTTGAWTVGAAQGGAYPVVPGTYTDAASGSGTPVVAVFKSGATERFRCSCGTGAGSFYRLLANIAANVPIKRGGFSVVMPPPPAVGTSEPVNTRLPAISGTAAVGAVLTCVAGEWTGNPVPSVTRQWYRASTAIQGATGLAYSLVLADAGALITCRETATNTVGSRTASSNSLGPVSAGPLTFAAPAQIDIYQGGTYSLAQHVSGGLPPYSGYALDSGTLPSGVTLNASTGVLSAAGDATVALSGNLTFGVDDAQAPVVPGVLPVFSLMSAAGGADLPFTFGHVFKQGDVPAGTFVNSNLTDWQAVPTTYWPDGSVRHAIISGRATCTANVLKAIQLSGAATDRAGTALTEANLATNLPATTLTCGVGGEVISLNALVGTAAKHRTVCAGPVMSNWLYRKQLAGSNHLVAWFDVRLYKGGTVEIFPWVENCYLTVASPINDVRTWTVAIGGSTRFSQSIDIKAGTRVPLLTGTNFSHWAATDPQITPKHDTAYMRGTKMVPNFSIAPSEALLAGMQQGYTPNTLAGMSAGMGAAGGNSAVLGWSGLIAQPAYVSANADARAYRACLTFGLSGGSWPVHYRAEAASAQGAAGAPNEPMRFADYPNASLQSGASPTIIGGEIPFPGAGPNSPVVTHQPSFGYLPWLITGRWWFLEEQVFWTAYNYLKANPSQRTGAVYGQDTGAYPAYAANGSAGIVMLEAGSYTVRGSAWTLRCLMQTLAILPDTHSSYASVKASWEANVGYYHDRFITGAYQTEPGDSAYADSIIGYVGKYGTNDGTPSIYAVPGFQSVMVCAAWGHAPELDLPQTTSAKLALVSKHVLKWVVGLTGPSDGWDYRFGTAQYHSAIGTVGGDGRPVLSASFADAFALQVTFKSLNTAVAGTELRYNNDELSVAGTSGWPYFGLHVGALASAVDAGVTGASAAWARMTAASNYGAMNARFADSEKLHVYAVTPRTL